MGEGVSTRWEHPPDQACQVSDHRTPSGAHSPGSGGEETAARSRNPADSTVDDSRRVSRRDQPVICLGCGRTRPRKARNQRFCSEKCSRRHRQKAAVRKAAGKPAGGRLMVSATLTPDNRRPPMNFHCNVNSLSVLKSMSIPFDLLGSDWRGRIDCDLRRVILNAEVGWLRKRPRAAVVSVSDNTFSCVAESESTATETDSEKEVETVENRSGKSSP